MSSDSESSDVLSWRRYLHQNPELSFKEIETSRFIESTLQGFGVRTWRLAPTGVIAEIGTGGPIIALRADIDALPVDEATGTPYASANFGVMHACGHDAHAAMLLAAAKSLSVRPPATGRVRLVFQAAEELPPGGAQQLVEAGLLEDVSMVFGIHVQSGLPVGMAAVGPGPVTANSDRFEILLHGSAGHAALPHQARDAIVMAGHLILALQTIVSRSVDPMSPAAVSIGQVEAGRAPNIIADRARLAGTVRSLQAPTQAIVEQRIRDLAQTTATAFGGSAEVRYMRGYPGVENALLPSGLFAQAARDVLGEDSVQGALTQLAGEDFGHYTRRVPGAFLYLGSGSEGRDFPHHHPRFDLDERALDYGVQVWLRLVDLALDRLAAPGPT